MIEINMVGFRKMKKSVSSSEEKGRTLDEFRTYKEGFTTWFDSCGDTDHVQVSLITRKAKKTRIRSDVVFF